MKLRVRGDSLRLRVTRGELDRLARGDTVREVVRFPAGTALVYALHVHGGTEWRAGFDGREVRIGLPAAAATRWYDPAEEGVRADLPVGEGATLALLVEKDFPCGHRPGADEADAFPRPGTPPAG
jgi:hypothetical protein